MVEADKFQTGPLPDEWYAHVERMARERVSGMEAGVYASDNDPIGEALAEVLNPVSGRIFEEATNRQEGEYLGLRLIETIQNFQNMPPIERDQMAARHFNADGSYINPE